MKKNIAILAGGNSSESVISLQSAEQVSALLDKEKYNTFTVYVKGNEWVVTSNKFCNTIVNKDDFSFCFNNDKIKFDFALIMIHGTPGEDGKLQSYFDLIHIPYSTSSALISAVTFNKYICKAVLNYEGINSAKAFLIRKGDKINSEEIIAKTGLPCFVKPNAGGSSFGISKVKKIEDLENAILDALKEDIEVIIEEFLPGTEVTSGVFNNNGELIALPITEIVSENEFFDYDAKYNGKSKEITPARVSKNVSNKVKDMSKLIYKKLNCKGVVRIDYMLNNSTPYFIEINTVPGMSSESIIPQQLKEYGMSVSDMYDIVISNV